MLYLVISCLILQHTLYQRTKDTTLILHIYITELNDYMQYDKSIYFQMLSGTPCAVKCFPEVFTYLVYAYVLYSPLLKGHTTEQCITQSCYQIGVTDIYSTCILALPLFQYNPKIPCYHSTLGTFNLNCILSENVSVEIPATISDSHFSYLL